ncbi:hypothetical protein KR51_00037620 [Rubidibacter lacunae KORDI 51-2]|uniref:Uncharacterized protein n=1 Tax=Rubidibacter lacunae KORDI 51-2 TaxID=582515 RepID=U5DGU9_9CHRO|nr:hypothetical protein [Rubidibacter lacunae]ERN39784.1 hypothetical protein KR51_00037620 [Rubidibacter lacunae KORDI 51-2]
MVDVNALRERVTRLESQRDVLVRLLEEPDLGTLRVDVNQAIEELDDLLEDFQATFPTES